MPIEKLQDFAASVVARGRVTFGDVRRLQRDYLPGGITTRDEAETLVALSDKLVRADKAWAQWLAVAVARYLRSQQASGTSGNDASREGADSLLAASTPLGRRIARSIRRELSTLRAAETENAPPSPAGETAQAEQPRPAPAPQMIRPIVCSEIVMRARWAPVPRRRRKAASLPILPMVIWSAGMMERHQHFQLQRPCL